jgi:hypothetical protein
VFDKSHRCPKSLAPYTRTPDRAALETYSGTGRGRLFAAQHMVDLKTGPGYMAGRLGERLRNFDLEHSLGCMVGRLGDRFGQYPGEGRLSGGEEW